MKNKDSDKQKVPGSVFHERRTGVVVPLGALYSKKYAAVGEFPALAEFARFCKKAGLSIIQLLPVNDTGTQSSPYSGLSAFALHPVYVSLPDIPEFAGAYAADHSFAEQYDDFINNNPYKNRFDYDAVLAAKTGLLRSLYETTPTAASGIPGGELAEWIRANKWIIPYAVYKNLKWKKSTVFLEIVGRERQEPSGNGNHRAMEFAGQEEGASVLRMDTDAGSPPVCTGC